MEDGGHAHALFACTKAILRAESPEAVLDQALELISRALGYHAAWFYLVTADDPHLYELILLRGRTPEGIHRHSGFLRDDQDALVREIATATEPVVVVDARTDPRTDKAIVEALGCRTIVNVRIQFRDRRLGALGTGTFADEGVRAPSDDDLAFLDALAAIVAAALEGIEVAAQNRRPHRAFEESDLPPSLMRVARACARPLRQGHRRGNGSRQGDRAHLRAADLSAARGDEPGRDHRALPRQPNDLIVYARMQMQTLSGSSLRAMLT